ncbi:MAG: ElyC/SanA/YdcF family protein [Cyanobacteria bacterium P01_D01_bin.56]
MKSMRCPNCKDASVYKCAAKSTLFPPYQCKKCQRIFYPSVRQARRWLLGLLVVAGISPWWINWALRLLVTRPDTGETVDAIVVIGRGEGYNERRAEAAVKLWQGGRAPKIFMSGASDAPVLVDLAKDMGVPESNISGEACAATTWENAFYTKRYMPLEKSALYKPKILLVTDGLHTGRATLLYRNFGFDVISHSVKLDFSQWRKHIKREFLAIMYYAKTKQLLPPKPTDYQRADNTAEKRVAEWQCLDMENAIIPHRQ